MMPGKMSPPPKQPGSKWPGFLINRSGLPFDELTWNELWQFASHLYPEARMTLREIQSAPLLAEVPHPNPPGIALAKRGRIVEYLDRVQDYMNQLTYNHTGTQFFETRPNSSMLTLMETAKAMVREALPIKCMEAVVLTIHLTNGVPGLGRFTINFKSELPQHQQQKNGKRFFYHVVLGVSLGNRFGACGLSRRKSLMDKAAEHNSLHSLVEEYDQSYRDCGQRLVKVRIGRLISHDPYSISPIPWKGLTIHPRTDEPKEIKTKLDKYSRELKSFLRVGTTSTIP